MWEELDLTPEENREDHFLIAQLKRISKPGPRTPSQAQPAARGVGGTGYSLQNLFS